MGGGAGILGPLELGSKKLSVQKVMHQVIPLLLRLKNLHAVVSYKTIIPVGYTTIVPKVFSTSAHVGFSVPIIAADPGMTPQH